MFMSLKIDRRFPVLLLVILSLSFGAYNLSGLIQKWDSQADDKNEVSIWENRLHSLKQDLPAGIDSLGYLAEWDLPNHQLPAGIERKGYMTEWDLPVQYRQIDQLNEFRLTKYVLAPVVVTRGFDTPWIIGNFSSVKFKPWLQDTIGNFEIKDIGGGIYLIHRLQQ